jgi:hypothetical protein
MSVAAERLSRPFADACGELTGILDDARVPGRKGPSPATPRPASEVSE